MVAWLALALGLAVLWIGSFKVILGACVPASGCDLAYVLFIPLNAPATGRGDELQNIAPRFNVSPQEIGRQNNLTDLNFIEAGKPLKVPFRCQCVDNELHGTFSYNVQQNQVLSDIATSVYHNLTRSAWIAAANGLANEDEIVYEFQPLSIPVNCSCGSPNLRTYGLFATYVVEPGDTLSSLAANYNLSEGDLRFSNPGIDWNSLKAYSDVLFLPATDVEGNFPAFNVTEGGNNIGAIVGGTIGGILGLVVVALVVYYLFCRVRGRDDETKQQLAFSRELTLTDSSSLDMGGSVGKLHAPGSHPGAQFIVDKSVEYSYEELAAATNNFSIANKVGEGGYGAVYYAELRDQKVAVKRMNLQASKEFLAELQVLTHVHHTNLVQLIGYCTVESLFLVYEFVENGTLDQHLHRASRRGTSLAWVHRVQIALDAARGLEYIHEHTKPTYIHRDVKSANILVDREFHAKVADFGLTKLTESVGTTNATKLAGTFGYMSPEYARFGDVSPKVDVYSFGVVLYEILSGKEAIVRTYSAASNSSESHKEVQKGLVTLFEAVLRAPDSREQIHTLMDPSLGNNYPLDSAYKMVQLARACTQENPELRPNMRMVVVALMTLSSSTQEWEISTFAGDQVIESLLSGR